MKKELVETGDGSKTLYIPNFDEHYHSVHGALSEAQHVYVTHGLKSTTKTNLSILEIGFGTGLNAFLTFLENRTLNKEIKYTALEPYPLSYDLANEMDYVGLAGFEDEEFVFRQFIGDRLLEITGRESITVFLSAAIFTCHHTVLLSLYFEPWQNVIASLGVFIAGVTWSIFWLRHRSLFVCWLSHAIADLAVFGIAYLILF